MRESRSLGLFPGLDLYFINHLSSNPFLLSASVTDRFGYNVATSHSMPDFVLRDERWCPVEMSETEKWSMTDRTDTRAERSEQVAVARAGPERPPAWLRGAAFDGVLVLGGPSVALAAGAVILFEPALFYPILVVDL